MRPLFALDVDGVLADFVGRLCERIRERASWCPIFPHDVVHWELSKCMSSEAFKVAMQVMNEPGFAYSLDVYDGARELVDTARSLGDVVALTAPLTSSPTWIGERTNWLVEKLGFNARDIVFCPSQHKQMFSADVLVEDSSANLEAWRKHQNSLVGCSCVDHPAGNFLVRRPWAEKGIPLAEVTERIATYWKRAEVAA